MFVEEEKKADILFDKKKFISVSFIFTFYIYKYKAEIFVFV